MGFSGTKRLVLLGPPGSGKGTQAERLTERLSVPAISTGDMVRAAIASGSDLGRRAKEIVAAGGLVDDETMGQIVRQRLDEANASSGFLLDGYPRTLPQAETLESIMAAMGHDLDGVLMIDVPEDELVRRLLDRQRADDREDVIRHRLEVYRQQTEPLVEHYRAGSQLIEVDGHQTIDDVAEAICQALQLEPEEVEA